MWPFRKRAVVITPAQAARVLSERRKAIERAPIRAETRAMRERLGMAPSPYLEN